MTMYPMSLYESSESSGEISIMVACRGGWPDSLSVKSDKAKLLIAKDYLNKVCNEDISSIDDVHEIYALWQRNLQCWKM